VLAKDRLIIPFDGKDLQFVVALDKQTGQTAWKATRSFVDGKMPYPAHSCCTPLVVQVNGIDQVLVPGAQRTVAYDLTTGKELWWVTHGGWSIVPRPIFGNGLFYTTTGYTAPDQDSTLMAIRPDGSGDVTESKVVWRTTRHVPMMPSPVLVSNRLFAVADEAGTAYCLDALTGADVWRQRIGGKYSASPLAAPGRIYFFDRDGTTTVVETADTFRVLARNKLESGCMASAAVAGRVLILRTKSHLYRIEK
jgi:outer membrane protein assembly factor BamB